ncbi:MAG: DUF5615 family PIN-like protein [Microthrixaceae bacterium]
MVDVRFCLDANLSVNVAEALRMVDHDVQHVSEITALGVGRVRGQQPAEDPDIADYCARTETVLVTIDGDFRGRWAKSGALARAGAEVIVFTKDLVGLREQHQIVTQCLPGWYVDLGSQPYAHRIWDQYPGRRHPDLRVGKRQKRSKGRSRPPVRTNP